MAKEIERKFLIDMNVLGELPAGIVIRQAYIGTVNHTVVRVRIAGDEAFLTLKGKNEGITRAEFEYPIPVEDAQQMIEGLCGKSQIDKTRYTLNYAEHKWEIDVFHGENEGLIIAEIELSSEDEAFEIPDWVKEEVTGQSRYYNSNLLENPFSLW